MSSKGKWKNYINGLPTWKRNALAGLALALTAALMPALLVTFMWPETMFLSLSVFAAILAICRLTHFLLKQWIKYPVLSAVLTIAILIGIMFSSWRVCKWYMFNIGGVCDGRKWGALQAAVLKQYPEYKTMRNTGGFVRQEKRCLIWESWGVIHVWMETSEPDKCREIADCIRSVKEKHNIPEKIELRIVDWNRTNACDNTFMMFPPFQMPGRKLSAFPPIFEETIE